MSAPIIACAMADAMGPLLEAMQDSIGHKASVERFVSIGDDSEKYVFFCCYIHAHGHAFQGVGDTPSRALMNANTSLQEFEEAAERIPA